MEYNLDIIEGELIEVPGTNPDSPLVRGRVFDVNKLGRVVFLKVINSDSEYYSLGTFRNVKKYIDDYCMFLAVD
jgi:hypothetical protein